MGNILYRIGKAGEKSMEYKRVIIKLLEGMEEEKEEEFLKVLYTIIIRHVIRNDKSTI